MTLEGARQTLRSKKDEETKRVEAVARLTEIKRHCSNFMEEFDRLHEQRKYSKTITEE